MDWSKKGLGYHSFPTWNLLLWQAQRAWHRLIFLYYVRKRAAGFAAGHSFKIIYSILRYFKFTQNLGRYPHSSIAVGSTIQSDGYHSYRKALANDYNHHYAVYDSNSDMLHWLHIIVGNAKAFILGTYHGNCKDNLQSFLDEFCYRFNRRHFKDELFTRLLNAVSHHYISGLAV